MVVRRLGRAWILNTILGTSLFTVAGCSAPASQNVAGTSSTLMNPLLGNTAAIAAGCELYGMHCAHCHGDEGHGNGPHAHGLTPPPANLVTAEALTKPDGHLFQRIWFGGQAPPYNSSMPKFSEVLTHDQVWQTLAYIRALAGSKVATCIDGEADHEHSHSHTPDVVAGMGAPQTTAATAAPSTAATAGTGTVTASMDLGASAAGTVAAATNTVAPTAGIGSVAASTSAAGQTAGSSIGLPNAGTSGHVADGAAGAHEH